MYATSQPDHAVIVVGTGFAGLGMAAKLKQEGIEDFVVLEQAASIGGTWRDNDYPGCACDVQSHLYSFSFAPNPDWSRMFAPQAEIRAYLEKVVDDFGLRPHIRFNSPMVAAEYDDVAAQWTVGIGGGEELTARVVVAGLGPLSRPAYPDIPGLDEFRGTSFHSAEWDHDYDFDGKRVAVIGTGASSIQFVPQLAKRAGRVHLFQRTAPWIVPKPDRPVTRFERLLFRLAPVTQRLYRDSIYWRLEGRVLGFAVHPKLMKGAELVARAHIRRQIRDRKLRRAVTPDYTIGCKRILISNDYYPALDRPHVDVIGDDIVRVTERGVVTADGREREVDAIVYGTGFKVTDPYTHLTIRGRDGLDIADAWANGIQSYLGTSVAGFPNFFLLLGPNTGLGHSSMVHMVESQTQYVADALATMRERNLRSVDVRADAMDEFNQRAAVAPGRRRVVVGLQELVPRRARPQPHAVARLHGRVPPRHAPFRARALRARARARPHPRRRLGGDMFRKPYDVRGKTVFITGAARGIGAETAVRLHGLGANVALVGLEPARLQALSERLGTDRTSWHEVDVTDLGSLQDAARATADRFGGIDVAIANAGVHFIGALATAPVEQVERELEVNLLGVWRTDRAVLPYVLERQGYILNIASLAAAAHAPLMGAYAASKAGCEALSNSLRQECAPAGTRVGVGYFGFIDTDIVRASFAHPSTQAMMKTMPPIVRTVVPLPVAIDAIVRGIERRSYKVWAPRYVGGALALRGLMQPLTERMAMRDKNLAEAIRLADPTNATVAGQDIKLGISAETAGEEPAGACRGFARG